MQFIQILELFSGSQMAEGVSSENPLKIGTLKILNFSVLVILKTVQKRTRYVAENSHLNEFLCVVLLFLLRAGF